MRQLLKLPLVSYSVYYSSHNCMCVVFFQDKLSIMLLNHGEAELNCTQAVSRSLSVIMKQVLLILSFTVPQYCRITLHSALANIYVTVSCNNRPTNSYCALYNIVWWQSSANCSSYLFGCECMHNCQFLHVLTTLFSTNADSIIS